MELPSEQSDFYRNNIPSNGMAQLLTELRFLLEHSIEARKVSIREYFSLLLTFDQQASAKNLKDHFHKSNSRNLKGTQEHKALLQLFSRVFSEYESAYIDNGEEFLWRIIDHLLIKLSDYQYCKECFNWQISKLPSLTKKYTSASKNKWYCPTCQSSIDIYQKFELFPTFLDYLVTLSNDANRFKKIKKKLFKKWIWSVSSYTKKYQHILVLFYEIFEDIYEFSIQQKQIRPIYQIWKLGEKLGFSYIFNDRPPHSFIMDYLLQQMDKGDYSDYAICLDYISKMAPPGVYRIQDFLLKGGIEKNILRAISTCNFEVFQHSFQFGLENNLIIKEDLLNSPHFSAACSRGLYHSLETQNLNNFELLVNIMRNFGLIFHVRDIPNRYRIMGNLLINSVKLRRMDKIFEIIEFGIKYDLYKSTQEESIQEKVRSLRNNRQLICCLQDLFTLKDSRAIINLLFFLYNYLPSEIFSYLMEALDFYPEIEDILTFLTEFVNNFTIYGLSLKKIGQISNFVKSTKYLDDREKFENDEVEISYSNRSILISLSNLDFLKQSLLSKPRKYEFLMLGMVMKGGLGPQGYGFVYLTPRGELVEICSDAKENDAYIIHFKQFLKDDFINELESRIRTLSLSSSQKERLIDILDGKLEVYQKIGISKEDSIMGHIRDFLEDEFDFNRLTSREIENLFKALSQKIHAILYPITLVDQYRCRLDLVSNGKVLPSDIAKLTSLGDKSHYDLLRERYFYQSLLNVIKKAYRDSDYIPSSAVNNNDLI